MGADGDARGLEAAAEGRDRVAVDQHRPALEADRVGRGRGDADALPGVEAEVVVVAAGGDEGGAAEVGHHLEADDVAFIGDDLDATVHYPIVSRERLKSLPKVPAYLVDACFAGANPAGLYKKH